MIDGSDMPITTGGTGAIESDRFGNHVADSAEGCFSCGVLTHTMDQCQTLDESFPFLPTGWQADHIGDQFILGPGLKRDPGASRWETPTDPRRGIGRPDQ